MRKNLIPQDGKVADCPSVEDLARSFYVWGGYSNCGNYPRALRECGLYFSQAIL
jgi:hypothetical protein